jgi:hypothetical protein
MGNSKIFSQSFSPYKNRYIYKSDPVPDDFFPDMWQTSENHLTDNMIESALQGLVLYGYFLSTCPRAFAVDIDDHTGKGEGYLLSVYESVCGRFKAFPSAVCRSPHGLHAHYFLTYPLPEILLIDRVSQQIKGLEKTVDVRPTHNTGLRIPRSNNFIDPENFHSLEDDFSGIVGQARKYHPAELFTDIDPAAIRQALKSRKAILRLDVLQKVARIEAVFYPIGAGATNEALCNLIPVYRTSDFSPDEAAHRFTVLLSPDYAGEMRNPGELARRIRSFYRNQPENQFTAVPKAIQQDLFTETIARRIADSVTGNGETRQQKAAITVKRNTVKNAVLQIEQWRNYIEYVKQNRQQCEMWNYLYPFFKKNTAEGYYPIPSSFFLKLHGHYEWYLLPFLKDVGYLERSPYGYSAGFGTCYHYKIHGENFL